MDELSAKMRLAMEDPNLTTNQRELLAEALMNKDSLTNKLLDSKKAKEISDRLDEKAELDKQRPTKRLPFYADGEAYNRLQGNFPEYNVSCSVRSITSCSEIFGYNTKITRS